MMKPIVKVIFFLAIILYGFAGWAQDVPNLSQCAAPPVYFTEEMPMFPGGQDSLYAYLQREIKYPLVAKENRITGTVLVEFVVEKDGRLTNGKVKVPLFPDCDVEALRGVMSMPRWTPGKNMGKPVRCFYQVPVSFKIDD
jgi:protein TonB